MFVLVCGLALLPASQTGMQTALRLTSQLKPSVTLPQWDISVEISIIPKLLDTSQPLETSRLVENVAEPGVILSPLYGGQEEAGLESTEKYKDLLLKESASLRVPHQFTYRGISEG